jgi:hypothetical protein
MKKVRYAAGAVGFAPILGLLAPGAAAAEGTAHAVTVPSGQGKAVRVTPATPCTGHDASRTHTGNFYIAVWHTPSTHCVGGVDASLKGSQRSGLRLRTRAYSFSGATKTRWFSNSVGGNINVLPPTISFYQGIHQIRPHREQVCEAIVYASPRANVFEGPLCVSF